MKTAPTSKKHDDAPAGEMLRTREAARLANVNSRTMARWCREGILRAVRFPGGFRIRRGDLEAFLSAGVQK